MISNSRIRGVGRLPRRRGRAVASTAAYVGSVLAISLPGVSRAQLSVDRVEAMIRPTSQREREVVINVRNDGDKTVQAVIRLEDWNRTNEGTNQWFPVGTQRGSCGKALSVFPLTASLDPGGSQNIRIMLDSALAPSSECWSAAIVETVQAGVRQGLQVGYVLRTAVKLYVQPPGLRADGEIPALRVAADGTQSASADSARHIEVEFENTGTVHVVAQGTVEFRRPDNSVAARVALPTVYTLPQARQIVKTGMPHLPPGRYVILATLDFGGVEIAAAQIEYEVVR